MCVEQWSVWYQVYRKRFPKKIENIFELPSKKKLCLLFSRILVPPNSFVSAWRASAHAPKRKEEQERNVLHSSSFLVLWRVGQNGLWMVLLLVHNFVKKYASKLRRMIAHNFFFFVYTGIQNKYFYGDKHYDENLVQRGRLCPGLLFPYLLPFLLHCRNCVAHSPVSTSIFFFFLVGGRLSRRIWRLSFSLLTSRWGRTTQVGRRRGERRMQEVHFVCGKEQVFVFGGRTWRVSAKHFRSCSFAKKICGIFLALIGCSFLRLRIINHVLNHVWRFNLVWAQDIYFLAIHPSRKFLVGKIQFVRVKFPSNSLSPECKAGNWNKWFFSPPAIVILFVRIRIEAENSVASDVELFPKLSRTNNFEWGGNETRNSPLPPPPFNAKIDLLCFLLLASCYFRKSFLSANTGFTSPMWRYF